MEHYERIRPGSKIAWSKCDCNPELKIDWRNRIIIKGAVDSGDIQQADEPRIFRKPLLRSVHSAFLGV